MRDPVLAGLRLRVRPGDNPGRRLARLVSGLVGAPTTAAEVHALLDDLRRVQRPLTTCRRILVAAVRGGAGATTLTGLLATVFATYRGDGALALETTLGHGSLEFRFSESGPAAAGVWTADQVAAMSQLPPSDVAERMSHEDHRVHLLPRPGHMGLDTYGEAARALMRFFGCAVIDGGHDALTQPGHLGTVHTVVLAIPATVDGVRTAGIWFRETDPELHARTVPVLMEVSPGSRLDPARVADALRDGGGASAVRALDASSGRPHLLPYDRSLATGAPVRTGLLAHRTTPTVVRIAATALALAG
ncbi:hypothetical protein [Micromonospora rosaria]|uniref:hypothetical protein n=1 Tax=Micromonospora rosaria TaxID=47874 RepID=UPI000AFB5B1B|nr:hypothetical protein [Micromonospora rosaria]